jgi:coenzyme F420 hydrogenase subunit beta
MERTKTFHDLQQEVIRRGLCSKCGGCLSFCSAWQANALEVGKDGLPRLANVDNCLLCGICYLVCPRTKELDTEVQERFGWKPLSWRFPIGVYRAMTSARATDEAILEVATDGGVVTSLLIYMLEHRLIDGAIVSRKKAIFSRECLIATTRQELIQAAGSQFSQSDHVEEIGEKYASVVKSWARRGFEKLAIVGTPCQIKTVRKMQCLDILPADIIRYTIGLFCMQTFSFDALVRGSLGKSLVINSKDIVKLNIKEDLIITLSNGITIHVPLEEIEKVACSACLACTEFTNVYADISVGGLGSPKGYSTTLIRTEDGDEIYSEALRRGYIEERSFRNAQELRNEKRRMLGKLVSFAKRKRKRGEDRLRELAAREDEGLKPL